ncbi:hypothetical protein ROTAS13_03356 [Roseomonas sp. TAS13]|uniref:hypothetical protein n=1 Tax=Roseomonas sp. TAS13 TaxID=1926319 RepID=UPI00096A06CB|nr:hypothetical protein [Roseomonas sp. TAS13]GAV35678.1 hypothetical protein ROTAS13_03356 [Roseomonas sp. TAS13]
MPETKDGIRVNRAPVLTLWAAVVAERLGYDRDAAITLGRAVAGSSARVKAKAIGIAEDHQEGGDMRDEARKLQKDRARATTVHLLGRDVSVVEEKGSVRALDHDKPAAPRAAASYVTRAFGEDLPAVRRAMEELAGSMEPEKLNRIGFRLYERFRPEVPAGAKGWGAKGVLDLARIRSAGR